MKNRVVFMGSSEFAVASLGALIVNDYDVVAVVTVPDKPAGRGRKISQSPVKQFADTYAIPILQPESLKEESFVNNLRAFNADIFVVVAFRMLPEVIWRIPPKGTINLHASLLPHYRGAAPINRVIMNGETVTGLTTFIIDDKIDTGNILMRLEVPISRYENAGDLHDRLMRTGAVLLIKTLDGLVSNSIVPQPQTAFLAPGEMAKQAPKIFTRDCFINWNDSSIHIHNFIRGLAPYPGARTTLANDSSSFTVKILEASYDTEIHSLTPGIIVSNNKNYLKIACLDGYINIAILQVEGKKAMPTQDFLRGFDISSCKIVSGSLNNN